MTYNVNFRDGKMRDPEELSVTVSVTHENERVPHDLGTVPISRSVGGDMIKLTLMPLPIRDLFKLRVNSTKENKHWTSSNISVTESFMKVNEGG